MHLSKHAHSLNVVGHEWGHGIVKFGPGFLIYGEAATLNEGIGDIYGYVFEQYANKKFNLGINNENWQGNNADPLNLIYNRSMKDPASTINDNTDLPYASFYHGVNWLAVDTEYYFRHHNAPVTGHWFYALSEGGFLSNQVNDDYYINGVGLDVGIQVVTQALRDGLLTNSASFHDVREATLQTSLAQNDSCLSYSIQQAWDYVGVYDGTNNNSIINPTSFFVDTTISNPININNNISLVGNIHIESTANMNDVDYYILPNTNLIIANGGSLYLNNSNIYFAENSGIIVENGGSLIVNSSLLTYGLDSTDCSLDISSSGFWNGITFNGNGTLSIDSSTISQTEFGLRVNSDAFSLKNSNYINNRTPLSINYSNTSTDTAYITNNIFKNDYAFLGNHLTMTTPTCYLKINGSPNTIAHQNVFANTLASMHMQGIKLNQTDPATANAASLKATYNNFINCSKGIYTTKGNYKYTINDNNFQNNFSNKQNSGIELYHSLIDVNNSIENNFFSNCDEAIHVENILNWKIKNNNISNTALGIKVYNSTSVDVSKNTIEGSTVLDKGIYLIYCSVSSFVDSNTISNLGEAVELKGCSHIKARANTMNDLICATNQTVGYGFFVQNCSDFELKDNLIDNSNVYPYDNIPSGPVGTRAIVIENANMGNNRVFRNKMTKVAVGVQTQGTNTHLRMKCNNSFAKQNGLLVFDQLENQGVNCQLELGKQQLPGNIWENGCDTSSIADKHLDILLDASALGNNFNYFAHAYGAGGERTAPYCTNANYTVCDGNNGNSEQIMASDFCSEINLYTGWSMPDREDGNSTTSSLTQEIIDYLAQKLDLSTEMANTEAQIVDPESQKDLVDELNAFQNEISNINQILLNLYQSNGNIAQAQQLLEQENSIEAKQLLVQNYIEQGNTVAAQRVILDLIALNKVDEAFFDTETQSKYEQNKNYQADILSIQNNLKASNRKINELNSTEIADLLLIRDANLPVATQAEILLGLNGFDLLVHPIKVMSTEYINQLQSNLVHNYQLSLNPNPASNQVNIQYDLAIDNANYSLKLIDNQHNIGNEIAAYNINASHSKIININNYISGIYTVAIFRNNVAVATTQLLIAH